MRDEDWPREGWLLRSLRQDRALHLNTVDDELWAASPYWAVRVDGEDHPITRLLAEFNLKAEPMECEVDDTIRRVDRTPPDFKHVMVSVDGELPPMKIGESPILVDTGRSIAGVYGPLAGGELVALSRDYLNLLKHMGIVGDFWHHAGSPLRPCTYMVEGSRQAILMPIRTTLRAS